MTINKVLLTSVILFTSAASVAQPLNTYGSYVSRVDHKTIAVEPANTKQQAYALGAQKLAEFEGMTANELNATLVPMRTYGSAKNTTHLKDDRYVTVEERLNSQGKVEYVAQVHMDVHYQERDSNN
ncbi:DUF3316 domain-containing protein [uncultured Vibrio sp.]|uniref:DUF3316 domain-containing protein n=1 Tax=uncultured Vibrio sp. TaxID=114054 RepID=UPI00262980F3|nr:DUF3316 domain-containing protein [uncultured Vibrio sp.]